MHISPGHYTNADIAHLRLADLAALRVWGDVCGLEVKIQAADFGCSGEMAFIGFGGGNACWSVYWFGGNCGWPTCLIRLGTASKAGRSRSGLWWKRWRWSSPILTSESETGEEGLRQTRLCKRPSNLDRPKNGQLTERRANVLQNSVAVELSRVTA